eukprot:SAG31_NODE_27078_length_431_cov_2.745283_1_plen_22_part_01
MIRYTYQDAYRIQLRPPPPGPH